MEIAQTIDKALEEHYSGVGYQYPIGKEKKILTGGEII